jgi:hypothetical protein
MSNFHRFVDPTYNLFVGESFPAAPGGTGTIGLHTYDRVNVTSGGTGGGGAANVDSQKSSGPTQYTYFVAFGEDGTSQNANRGFRALAENCDVLDDLFRTNTPKYSTQVTVGAAQNRVVLTGDIFVGDAGSVVGDLIALQVLDGTLSAPYSGGTVIQVTDIDNGTPASTVIGSGFHTNPTAQLSAPLPVGASYRFIFFTRTSTGRVIEVERQELSKRDALELQGVFSASRVFAFGLNEFYRRALAKPDTFNNNTPGDGATIARDGKAVTLVPSPQNWTTTPYHDAYLANVLGGLSAPVDQSIIRRAWSGDMNYVQLGMWRMMESSVDELVTYNRPLSSFTALNVRNPVNTTFGGSTTYTYIPKDSAATLNVGGADADAIEVGGALYFRNGSGRTALLLGYDLLIVTRAAGHAETYIVNEILSNTSVRVVTPGGAQPVFPADEAVTITWAQPLFTAGGAMTDAAEDPNWGLFNVIYPPFNANDVGQYDAQMPPCRFIAPAVAVTPQLMLTFGEMDPFSGTVTDNFAIYADGHIVPNKLTTFKESKNRTIVTVPGVQTFNWDIDVHGSNVVFRFTASDSELTIDVAVGYTPAEGDKFEFEFEPVSASMGSVVTWGDSRFYEDIETIDIIGYNATRFQTVSGVYNASKAKFVSTLRATPGTTLREKLSILRDVRTYFRPPLVSSASDDGSTLFVGHAGSLGSTYFIAHRGGTNLYYSIDGRSPWSASDVSALSSAMSSRTARDIAGTGALIMLATSIPGSSVSGHTYYSNDGGLVWAVGPDIAATEAGFKKITYAAGDFWGLTVGGAPTNPVYFGDTAAPWAAATITGGHYLWELDSDGSTVVFVGNDGAGNGVIYSSATTPGLTLEQTTTGNNLQSVAYMPYYGRWVAMGEDGSEVWTSDDGFTWTSRVATGMGATRSIRSLVAMGPVLVAAAVLSTWAGVTRRYEFYMSGDCGRTWSALTGTYVSTAAASFDVSVESAFMMPVASGKYFIFSPGAASVTDDVGVEATWLSGKLGND